MGKGLARARKALGAGWKFPEPEIGVWGSQECQPTTPRRLCGLVRLLVVVSARLLLRRGIGSHKRAGEKELRSDTDIHVRGSKRKNPRKIQFLGVDGRYIPMYIFCGGPSP